MHRYSRIVFPLLRGFRDLNALLSISYLNTLKYMKIFKSRNIYDQMKHTSTIIVYLFIKKRCRLGIQRDSGWWKTSVGGGYKDVLVAKEAIQGSKLVKSNIWRQNHVTLKNRCDLYHASLENLKMAPFPHPCKSANAHHMVVHVSIPWQHQVFLHTPAPSLCHQMSTLIKRLIMVQIKALPVELALISVDSISNPCCLDSLNF